MPRARVELSTRGFSVRLGTANLLNKLTVSQIAELSNHSGVKQSKQALHIPSEEWETPPFQKTTPSTHRLLLYHQQRKNHC